MNKGKIVRDKNGTAVDMEDPPARVASFWTIVGGMGLSVAPFASMIHDISPTILPAATLITLGVMGGASLYAYNTPSKALSPWKGPLYGSLLGIVGVGLTGLLSGLILGPQSILFQMLHNVNVYGGVVLFSAFTAYDTHNMIERYEKGDPDSLSCATDFYLNFMNLLVRFMEILAKTQKK
jgi:FtsH-binding integral membrane protein